MWVYLFLVTFPPFVMIRGLNTLSELHFVVHQVIGMLLLNTTLLNYTDVLK